MGVTPPEKGN